MEIVEAGHYSCVYQIRNLVNGKVYVGSTARFDNRCAEHKYGVKKQHHNIHLQNAVNKYGASNFVIEPIEKVLDKNDLIAREQYWIDALDACESGYNLRSIADRNVGIKHTPEQIEKMRAYATGRIPGNKGVPITEEHRSKISDGLRRHYLTHKKVISPEQRQKLSEAAKRRYHVA